MKYDALTTECLLVGLMSSFDMVVKISETFAEILAILRETLPYRCMYKQNNTTYLQFQICLKVSTSWGNSIVKQYTQCDENVE